MNQDFDLTTFSEASKQLGVSRQTIADLCAAHGLIPKRFKLNNLAKGLTKHDMNVLRECLGLAPGGKVKRCPEPQI